MVQQAVQIHDKGIQIGSSGGGISFDLDGNAAFNGSITISKVIWQMEQYQGSAREDDIIWFMEYRNDVSKSAKITACSASKELRTQIVLDSGGMALKNESENKTLKVMEKLQRYLMVKTTIHL